MVDSLQYLQGGTLSAHSSPFGLLDYISMVDSLQYLQGGTLCAHSSPLGLLDYIGMIFLF